MWDHSSESLKHEGHVRIFVYLREKDEDNNFDNGFNLISVETFQFGLVTGERKARYWIEETIREDCGNHLYWKMKEELELENGFYELVGEFYYDGWTSGYYEPEYEDIWDIRKVQYRELTFDEAYREAVKNPDDEEELYGNLEEIFANIDFGRYEWGKLFYREPDETLYKKIVEYYGTSNYLDRHIDDRKRPDLNKSTIADLINWFDNIMKKPDYPEEFDDIKEFLAERALLI